MKPSIGVLTSLRQIDRVIESVRLASDAERLMSNSDFSSRETCPHRRVQIVQTQSRDCP